MRKDTDNMMDEKRHNDEKPKTPPEGDDSAGFASLGTHHQPRSIEDLFEQSRTNWWIFLALGMANSSDASEILCLSYILADPVFKEHILHESTGGLLTGSVFCGMLLGGLYIGIYSDHIGRHPALLSGLILNGAAGITSCIVTNVTQLCIIRFIAGIGIGATVPPLFALASELTSDSKRGWWVSVVASFWMIGSLFVAIVAYCILDKFGWRVFGSVCALPSCVGASLVYTLVPESPRFLLLQGRYQNALDAANRSVRTPTWTIDEVLYHHENAATQGRLEERTALESIIPTVKELYTDSFRTAVTLQVAWFSLSFASYGLLTWINRIFAKVGLEDVYFNEILFAGANLPGNIFAAVFLDRLGRGRILSGSLWVAALSLITFAAFSRHQNLVVLSACVFQGASVSAWNAIDVITSEGFPVSTRSTGLSACAATGRIGAGIAQLCNAALIDSPVQLLMLSAFMLMVGSMTPCCLPIMASATVESGYNRVQSA
jgi:MFS transporter, VNT family, synaptic vesicle glycoprotein 2